jgi:hypothetical protein
MIFNAMAVILIECGGSLRVTIHFGIIIELKVIVEKCYYYILFYGFCCFVLG